MFTNRRSLQCILFYMILILSMSVGLLTQTKAQAKDIDVICGLVTWDLTKQQGGGLQTAYGYLILVECDTGKRFWLKTLYSYQMNKYYQFENAQITDLTRPLDLQEGLIKKELSGWSNYKIINSCSDCTVGSQNQPPTDTPIISIDPVPTCTPFMSIDRFPTETPYFTRTFTAQPTSLPTSAPTSMPQPTKTIRSTSTLNPTNTSVQKTNKPATNLPVITKTKSFPQSTVSAQVSTSTTLARTLTVWTTVVARTPHISSSEVSLLPTSILSSTDYLPGGRTSRPLEGGGIILIMLFGTGIIFFVLVGGLNLKVGSVKSKSKLGKKLRRDSASIYFISGPFAGKTIHLSQQAVYIGRGSSSTIRIPDISLSRSHVVIYYQPGRWVIRDEGSKYGTYINGQRIQSKELKHRDRIQIGSSQFEFRLN
jgi:hypothetical protein